MKAKAHILVVEDKALIYKRLKMILKEHHYSVADYAPSVEEALGLINIQRPDLVLLDIDLQGEYNGMYLGKLLKENYHIPFIYVTDYDDDQTFYESLQTSHKDFISKKELELHNAEVIQTKPHLDEKRLIRSIQTALQMQREAPPVIKDGIIGLVGYLEEVRNYGKGGVTRVPVKYEDIAYFTVTPFTNENNEEEALRDNYLWFLTKKKEYYFLKSSLRKLEKCLPKHFIRINETYIINVSSDLLEGRINGSRLSILGKELRIKRSYAKEFEKQLDLLYHS